MGPGGLGVYTDSRVEWILPLTLLDWNPNTDRSKGPSDTDLQSLLIWMKAAARKPNNLSKISEVIQENQESPTGFLEHLWEAHQEFTPICPDAPENQQAINIAFVT